MLHPAHKLHYFEKAGWERPWITAAEEVLCSTFDLSYKEDDELPVQVDEHEKVVQHEYDGEVSLLTDLYFALIPTTEYICKPFL